jgi:hypothetical protein
MRKMFEFEYNPCKFGFTILDAENAIKAFTDISFKQVKVIQPTQSCKMDALFVFSKYFDRNGMND